MAAQNSLMGFDNQKPKYLGRQPEREREILTEEWEVGSCPNVNQLSHLLNNHRWLQMHSVIEAISSPLWQRRCSIPDGSQQRRERCSLNLTTPQQESSPLSFSVCPPPPESFLQPTHHPASWESGRGNPASLKDRKDWLLPMSCHFWKVLGAPGWRSLHA